MRNIPIANASLNYYITTVYLHLTHKCHVVIEVNKITEVYAQEGRAKVGLTRHHSQMLLRENI
ncbi:unnamed protein product [Spodoptera exigua]|nr:unnamed protein product [Spodoptera exigua]